MLATFSSNNRSVHLMHNKVDCVEKFKDTFNGGNIDIASYLNAMGRFRELKKLQDRFTRHSDKSYMGEHGLNGLYFSRAIFYLHVIEWAIEHGIASGTRAYTLRDICLGVINYSTDNMGINHPWVQSF